MSCISNSAYTQAEGIRTRAVQINAVLKSAQLVYEAMRNGQDLIDNYRKQHELAKRAQAMAEAIQGQASMFWAAENKFRDDFLNPEPIEDIEVMARRYAGRLISSVLGGFATKIHEVKCQMNRYCTSANTKALQDIYLMRSFAVGAARVLARNMAHAEWQARNDLNWERRKQAAALGKKLSGDASSLIASAGKGLASIGAGYEQGLKSALQGVGLAMTRPMLEGYRADDPRTAGMMEVDTSETTQYYSNNGATMYGPDDGGVPYQSNNGSPMYGPENTSGMNGLATSFSNNETQPPVDLLGTQSIDGGTGDGDELPNLYTDGMNQNDNGPRDRVRTGKIRFPVIGGFGNVEIDMDKFPVAYADHLETAADPAKTPVGDQTWPS